MRHYGEESRRRCESKIRYETWAEAEDAAVALLEDLRDGKLRILKTGNVFAYQCVFCEWWHVGHVPGPKNPWNHYEAMLNKQASGKATRTAVP